MLPLRPPLSLPLSLPPSRVVRVVEEVALPVPGRATPSQIMVPVSTRRRREQIFLLVLREKTEKTVAVGKKLGF